MTFLELANRPNRVSSPALRERIGVAGLMPRISIYIRIILFSSILVFLPVFVSSLLNYQAAKTRLEQDETLQLREIVTETVSMANAMQPSPNIAVPLRAAPR
ncbi:MAG: hypothetical protein CMO80_12335 [Verrucomicrobiales bacterium]|nr:hypothetical protein [Verrucomicrobiales bacterium]